MSDFVVKMMEKQWEFPCYFRFAATCCSLPPGALATMRRGGSEGSQRHGKHPVREAKMTETLGFGLKLNLRWN